MNAKLETQSLNSPTLNWKELELLVGVLRSNLEERFLDRIFIPERKAFPAGYLKEEWVFRFTSKKQEDDLLISVRPRHPYIAWASKQNLRSASQATRSPFDLYLSKNLCGSRLIKLEALHQERVVVLWFSHPQETEKSLGLVLVMIPARPEALLVCVPKDEISAGAWPILVRSRTLPKDAPKESFIFSPPDGSKAPPDLKLRHEVIQSPEIYLAHITQDLEKEAFLLRIQNAEKNLKQLLKQAKDRLKQNTVHLREAQKEPDWQRWGDLLKSSLGASPERIDSQWRVMDYETDQIIAIPADPKLDLASQVKRYYDNAKRKQRRLEESTQRVERFGEAVSDLEKNLASIPELLDWSGLERFERRAGILPSEKSSGGKRGAPKHLNKWSGKTFVSKDGFLILAGRSKDENLELTFKVARGNDLWMHVQGRPGAHVVISLPAGKSAPLETLLDAAQLTLHYSGGKDWGKTEIDYTFKKHVKRMKDSSEAIYTHNKTLLVSPDPDRLKRLLGP